jgi:hypothetical protein
MAPSGPPIHRPMPRTATDSASKFGIFCAQEMQAFILVATPIFVTHKNSNWRTVGNSTGIAAAAKFCREASVQSISIREPVP